MRFSARLGVGIAATAWRIVITLDLIIVLVAIVSLIVVTANNIFIQSGGALGTCGVGILMLPYSAMLLERSVICLRR